MRPMSSLLLLASLCGAPALSWAEVRDASPSGFTIENTRRVPVDAATAWHALVADIDRWWPKDHSWWGAESVLRIEPHAGGCFCEQAADGRQARHMQVVFVEPGKLLRMAGGLGPLQGMGVHGAMEWRLAEVDGGTAITLWYRVGGYSPDDLGKLAAAVDGVQALQLGALAEHLER